MREVRWAGRGGAGAGAGGHGTGRGEIKRTAAAIKGTDLGRCLAGKWDVLRGCGISTNGWFSAREIDQCPVTKIAGDQVVRIVFNERNVANTVTALYGPPPSIRCLGKQRKCKNVCAERENIHYFF